MSPATQPAGTKNDAGKVGLHLLPPGALFEIAQVLDFGVKKYAAWNWSKGMAASRLFAAALGHLWAWWCGEENDPETNLPHLAHLGCCVLFLLELRRTRPAGYVDDRPIGQVTLVSRDPDRLTHLRGEQ